MVTGYDAVRRSCDESSDIIDGCVSDDTHGGASVECYCTGNLCNKGHTLGHYNEQIIIWTLVGMLGISQNSASNLLFVVT